MLLVQHMGENLKPNIRIQQNKYHFALLTPRRLSRSHLNYSMSKTPYISRTREYTHRISVIRNNQIHYKEYNASEFHHLYRTATEITDAASITKNQNMVALAGRYKNCHTLLKVILGFRHKN